MYTRCPVYSVVRGALHPLWLERSKDGRQREEERGEGENNGSEGSKRTMKTPQDHPPPPLLLRTNPPQRIISVPRHPNRGFKVKGAKRECAEKGHWTMTVTSVFPDDVIAKNLGDIRGAIFRSISLLKQLRTTMYFIFLSIFSVPEPRLYL